MIRETYKGRELKVVKASGGGLVGSINGQPVPTRYGVPEQEVIEQFHRDIDHVDRAPVDGDRWGAYVYAPGTYELCDIGHPKAIGGPCRHSSYGRGGPPAAASPAGTTPPRSPSRRRMLAGLQAANQTREG